MQFSSKKCVCIEYLQLYLENGETKLILITSVYAIAPVQQILKLNQRQQVRKISKNFERKQEKLT